jgi:hypothetical protein
MKPYATGLGFVGSFLPASVPDATRLPLQMIHVDTSNTAGAAPYGYLAWSDGVQWLPFVSGKFTSVTSAPPQVTLGTGAPSGGSVGDYYIRLDGTGTTFALYKNIASVWTQQTTSGGGTWGSITGTLSSQADLTSYVSSAVSSGIASLVASSPAALDTLNELAAALGNDANFATTVTNSLAAKTDKINVETTVASATTTDIGAVGSQSVLISGATPIVGFGTAAAGIWRRCRAAGVFQIVHNATSNIVVGGQSITTAVNDTWGEYSLGSGNWVMFGYQRANGQPVIPVINSATTQDTTAFTWNTDNSVLTYTLNGLTWTVAYNGDGTPNTETSGSLVKTYTYSSGRFAGITGAVNAGETRVCTIATLPTAANSSPGDRVFVTDVAQRVVGATDQGNLGQMFQFFGATGTGRWVPTGSYSYTRRVGPLSGTLGALSTVSGSIQAVPIGGAGSLGIPVSLQVPGNRFRVFIHVHRTGAIAAANLIIKSGTAGTSSDTTVIQSAMSGTNNASSRIAIDVLITSSTTATLTGTMNSGSNSADGATGNGAAEITLNGTNTLFITPWISAVSSGDAYQALQYEIEQLP